MKSAKRCLPVLAMGMVFFFTSTLAADSSQAILKGSTLKLPTLPCINNLPLELNGITTVDIQQNSTGDSPHVVVHVQVKADGQDDAGNSYQVNMEGTAQSDGTASIYPVLFHSQWVGQGAAPNFPLTGTITVFMKDDGTVNYTLVTSVDLPTCTN